LEKIVKSEVISYTRKVRGRNKKMKDLRYFVKWKGCAEDENTWEPPEGWPPPEKRWKGFIEKIPKCRGMRDVE